MFPLIRKAIPPNIFFWVSRGSLPSNSRSRSAKFSSYATSRIVGSSFVTRGSEWSTIPANGAVLTATPGLLPARQVRRHLPSEAHSARNVEWPKLTGRYLAGPQKCIQSAGPDFVQEALQGLGDRNAVVRTFSVQLPLTRLVTDNDVPLRPSPSVRRQSTTAQRLTTEAWTRPRCRACPGRGQW